MLYIQFPHDQYLTLPCTFVKTKKLTLLVHYYQLNLLYLKFTHYPNKVLFLFPDLNQNITLHLIVMSTYPHPHPRQ